MRDLAFALCWLVLLPVSLYSAYAGVLIWIWVAIFSPNDLLFGFMQGVQFNKIIAVSTFAVLLLGSERKNFYVDKTVVALLLLLAVGTVAATAGIADSATGSDLYWKLVKELTLAVLIMGTMWSRYRIHMGIFTMCIAFGFEGVVESAEYIVSGGTHKVLGVASVGDNNSLAVEILMSIPLLWYLFQYSAARYMKIALGVVLAMSVVTVIATYSRGGFVGLLLLGLFFVAKSRNKLGGVIAIGAVGILLFVAVPDNYSQRVNTIDDLHDDSSFSGRLNAWKVSTVLAFDSPFYGGGFHAIQQGMVWDRYKAAAQDLTFPETPPIEETPRAAHSIYFEVLGDLGFTGLAVFGAIILISLRATSRIKKLVRRRPEHAWAGDLASMLQISLVIYCVCGAALSLAYWEGFYIFVALTSRLQRTVMDALKAEAADLAPGVSRFGLVPSARHPVPAGPGGGSVGHAGERESAWVPGKAGRGAWRR